jgi:hypothetical protein
VLGHQADILVMRDDWSGKFDCLNDICQVACLPRTQSVSAAAISSTLSIIPGPYAGPRGQMWRPTGLTRTDGPGSA